MPEPFKARQSLLRAMSQCGRRTQHELAGGFSDLVVNTDLIAGYTGHSADLGRVMHATAEELLRTMHAQGETQVPSQEAVEVAREVYAKSGVILPLSEAEDLIFLTIRFAERTWRVDKLLTTPEGELAIEQRIEVPLVCPDGTTRVLTVTPDALFAGGGATVVAGDWKTGRQKPKSPRAAQEEAPEGVVRGMQYLSDQGHYQALAQGLGVLHRYPACDRFVFREFWLRSGEIREAILGRDNFEHAREFIAIDLMKLEGAMADPGSEVWKPRPGKWCTKACSVARSCPIPEIQRGEGGVEDQASADRAAEALMVVDAQRTQIRDSLKSFFTETGNAARIGDGREIRWDGGKGGAFEIVDASSEAAKPEHADA
jgi:hypothetical protein